MTLAKLGHVFIQSRMENIQSNLSRPNLFRTEEFVQFRQVFGLNRFKLHRHLVDGTVKSVWFRQVFGLLRVRFRLVSLYMYTCDKEMTITLTQTSFVYINKILNKYYTYGASQPYNK
jgi:hypothetical protein